MSNTYVVALMIDKVQSVLTNVIQSHEQDKQVEEHTLRNIMNSSREISQDFFREVTAAFPEAKKKQLLACSGVYIFTSSLPEESIAEKLNKLFRNYYEKSYGQALLRHVYFEAKSLSEISMIQEAKTKLKQSTYLNVAIEKNQDLLFSFQAKPAPPSLTSNPNESESPASDVETMSMFVTDINQLFCEEEADNKNHFRIAIIKADLDGMGNMFKKIKDYASYCRVSKTLYDGISLEGLHKAAEACKPENKTAWLFPFFIAGDDIFFAVSVSDLLNGIRVCQYILRSINDELRTLSNTPKPLVLIKPQRPLRSLPSLESLIPPQSADIPEYPDIQELTISIGAQITFNREPIRYYLELVSKQLQYAKDLSCPDELQEFLNGKIAIGGSVFLDISYDAFKAKKQELADNAKEMPENRKEIQKLNQLLTTVPVWSFFLYDVNLLLVIKNNANLSDYIGGRHFFYSLLERLTSESVVQNNRQYLNILLYHLLPKYMDSPDEKLWQAELLLNASIIKQLYFKGNGDKGKGNSNVSNRNSKEKDSSKQGSIIQLTSQAKHRLESYLRLLLLFADERFQIAASQKTYEDLLQNDNPDRINDARKQLISKVPQYLYEGYEGYGGLKYEPLTKYFIKGSSYILKPDAAHPKESPPISYYRRLRVKKSAFIKLRNIEKNSEYKAADLLSLFDAPDDENGFNKASNQASSRYKVAPIYKMNFEKEKFIKEFETVTRNLKTEDALKVKETLWNTDFIDSLMLFYQYEELKHAMKMQKTAGKSQTGTSKEGRKNNGK